MNAGGRNKPRLAHRVTALFLLSAVLPLSVCAVIVFGKFRDQVSQAQVEQFDATLRSYGNTLMGRLISADQVLNSLTNNPLATDASVQSALRRLEWLDEAALTTPAKDSLPISAAAGAALKAGDSVLTARFKNGYPDIILLHRSPGGGVLAVKINSSWLWDDPSSFAGRAYLAVLDEQGRTLTSTGDAPRGGIPRNLTTQTFGVRQTLHADGWNGRTWELFLSARFSAPSWHLVMMGTTPNLLANRDGGTYFYLLGLVALTILLISWTSMVAIRRQLRPLRVLSRATRHLAKREFDAFDGLHWDNEFGELAQSFRAMAAKLKLQFGVLDTLSDVDRQLLNSPRLESILEALLPQVADLLGCETVSLMLFDDERQGVRAFDYVRGQSRPVTARPVAVDGTLLVTLLARADGAKSADDLTALRSLVPASNRSVVDVQILSLGRGSAGSGVLCLGYSSQSDPRADTTVSPQDFADRLTLVLANLQQAETLRQQAHFDALTGLENREQFASNADDAVRQCLASGSQGYLLYIDLDQFKQVNDTAGHAAGDQLLQVVASRIRGLSCEGQHVSRLGGDEFAVLARQMIDADEAQRHAQAIIAALERDIDIEGRRYLVSASIGIALFPDHGRTADELLKSGDIAMYQAKAAGRGRAQFFQHDMQHRLNERVRLEKELTDALARNEFILHYQPIVNEADESISVEALVRWSNPRSLTPIAPSTFIPLAEANGLIVKLGEWILRRACQQYAAWRELGIELTYISVNVSVRQLQEPGYCADLVSVLSEFGLRADELQIEVTESVLAHEQEIRPILEKLAGLGVRLALDDFGTGYSSLSYLRDFPIRNVKIDRSFIMGIPQDLVSCQLTASIVAMCLALGKTVTAEGVETESQRAYLRELGCTCIQGFLLGRPMESIDVPGFVARLRGTEAKPQRRARRN